MLDVRHLHAGVEDPDGEWEWEWKWGMEQQEEARPWMGHVMQETWNPSRVVWPVARGLPRCIPPLGLGAIVGKQLDARLYRVPSLTGPGTELAPPPPGNPDLD